MSVFLQRAGLLSSGAAGGGYTQNFVDTGAARSAFLQKTDLTGAADSSVMTIAFTVKGTDISDSGTYEVYDVFFRSRVLIVNEEIRVRIRNPSAVELYEAESTDSPLVAGNSTAVTFVVSVNLGATPTVQVEANGVALTMSETVAPTQGTIDHAGPENSFLRDWVGDASDYFLDIKNALSPSLFHDGNNPQDLNGVGAPIVFCGDTMVASDWNSGTNLGSGGTLDVSGTFVDA